MKEGVQVRTLLTRWWFSYLWSRSLWHYAVPVGNRRRILLHQRNKKIKRVSPWTCLMKTCNFDKFGTQLSVHYVGPTDDGKSKLQVYLAHYSAMANAHENTIFLILLSFLKVLFYNEKIIPFICCVVYFRTPTLALTARTPSRFKRVSVCMRHGISRYRCLF